MMNSCCNRIWAASLEPIDFVETFYFVMDPLQLLVLVMAEYFVQTLEALVGSNLYSLSQHETTKIICFAYPCRHLFPFVYLHSMFGCLILIIVLFICSNNE